MDIRVVKFLWRLLYVLIWLLAYLTDALHLAARLGYSGAELLQFAAQWFVVAAIMGWPFVSGNFIYC